MHRSISNKALVVGVLVGAVAGASSVYNANLTAFVGIDPNYARTMDSVNQNIDPEDDLHDNGEIVKSLPRIQDRLKDQGSYYWRNAATSDNVPKHCYGLSNARLAKCIVAASEGIKYRRSPSP